MLDLFENVWGGQEEIVVDHAAHVTLEVSLLYLLCLYFMCLQ